eukprot:COSAG02_NODE_40083_length_409_cov_1.003226_2_plen_40_part_01
MSGLAWARTAYRRALRNRDMYVDRAGDPIAAEGPDTPRAR